MPRDTIINHEEYHVKICLLNSVALQQQQHNTTDNNKINQQKTKLPIKEKRKKSAHTHTHTKKETNVSLYSSNII